MCAHCNDCVTYPFDGPPNARSNTWIGFNNCLNFLTNLTPWKKRSTRKLLVTCMWGYLQEILAGYGEVKN